MAFLMVSPSLSDAATLTTSSVLAASSDITDLQKIQPVDKVTFLVPSTVFMEFDFGAATAIDFVALLYTNASSTATWQVRGATSQANLTAAPGYDSTSQTLWPVAGLDDWDFVHAFLDIGTDQTYQWWRIDVTDSSNPDSVFTAGRVLLGNAWRPSKGLLNRDGASVRWKDFSNWNRSIGGQIYVDRRTRHREIQFGVSLLPGTEVFPNSFDRIRGKSQDVLVSLDASHATLAHEWTVSGLMRELQPAVSIDRNLWRKRFIVEELL